MQKITKAVFPVAGLGTRFLPATKASPKEMLPIVDKPLIQYAAEEAMAAGVDTLIFITGRSKRAIGDHFDKAYELETELEQRGKLDRLAEVQNIVPKGVSCIFIRQAEALGLGHAVLCAKPVVNNEPFAVILADDLIKGNVKSCLEQMNDVYNEHGCSVLGCERVPPEDTSKYGVIAPESFGERLEKVLSIVEKPKPADAPSNLAVVGRYLLTPRIFSLLENLKPGAGGEFQLTDAIAELLKYETVFGYEFDGKRYDCGSKLGYVVANMEYAMEHAEIGQPFRDYLQTL